MINYIKDWSDNNNILVRTLEMFWNCFEVYCNEDYEEFITVFPEGKTNVNLKFDKISFEIDLPDFLQELIAVTIDIYVYEKKVGWFKQLYLLSGEPFDEYFVID